MLLRDMASRCRFKGKESSGEEAHIMQREGSSVGAIVQQPFDSLLVFIGTFIFQVRTARQDVVDLGRDTNIRTLRTPASTTLCRLNFLGKFSCHSRKEDKNVVTEASLLSCCE